MCWRDKGLDQSLNVFSFYLWHKTLSHTFMLSDVIVFSLFFSHLSFILLFLCHFSVKCNSCLLIFIPPWGYFKCDRRFCSKTKSFSVSSWVTNVFYWTQEEGHDRKRHVFRVKNSKLWWLQKAGKKKSCKKLEKREERTTKTTRWRIAVKESWRFSWKDKDLPLGIQNHTHGLYNIKFQLLSLILAFVYIFQDLLWTSRLREKRRSPKNFNFRFCSLSLLSLSLLSLSLSSL